MNTQMKGLTFDEQQNICGGDWFEAEWGMMLTFALLGGALVAPELLVGAALVGGVLAVTQ